MIKSEKLAPNFASLCSLVSGVRVLDKEKIQPHEASVLCEATASQSKCEYYFDHVINGKGEIANAYRKYLHPLVDQVLGGKSVAMLANSIPKNDFAPYLIGVEDAEKPSPAILISIVMQLLKVQAGAKAAGTVTFSWFKLNCDKSETLVDVLREASGPQGNDKKANDLLLREVGRGRGMTVSGLWEVELASAGDIEAIVNHVLQVYAEADNMTNAHSVFQFVYTPANTKKAAAPASKSIMTSQHDAAGVGRLNFIVMSSLTAYDYNTLSLAKIAHHPMAAFEHDWILKLQHVMEWIASGRPSPPYHKSRLVLLLRDVLCGRQPCALLQCIDKFTSNNGHQPNAKQSDVVSMTDMQDMYMDTVHKWFQIMSSISATRDPKLVTSNPFSYPSDIAAASTEAPTKKAAAGPPKSGSSSATGKDLLGKKTGVNIRSVAAKRAASPHNRPLPAPAAAPAAEKRSSSTPRDRTNPNPPEAVAHGNADEAGLRDNLKKKLEGSGSQRDISPAWAASAAASVSAASPNPPPPPPNRDVGDLVPSTIPFADPNTHGHGHALGVAEQDHSHEHAPMRRKSTFHSAHGHGHGHDSKDDHSHGGMSDMDKHAMTLLNKALEEQKRETATITGELEDMREKYDTCREAYELLVDTIKQDGSMLKQKDRENYSKALRDLKDYAIYKDVIEAAMVRLQGELDAVLQENKTLKEDSEKNLRAMRKKLNTSQRYDHYATNVHKKYAEADSQISALEQDKKKLAREKDQLHDALTHCRAQLHAMQDKYENEENNISYNALLLKVNEYENNSNFRKYKSRRGGGLGDSMMSGGAAAEQELVSLKAAHAKALEKLMTLQEENDDMRQAVSSTVSSCRTNSKHFVLILCVFICLYSLLSWFRMMRSWLKLPPAHSRAQAVLNPRCISPATVRIPVSNLSPVPVPMPMPPLRVSSRRGATVIQTAVQIVHEPHLIAVLAPLPTAVDGPHLRHSHLLSRFENCYLLIH